MPWRDIPMAAATSSASVDERETAVCLFTIHEILKQVDGDSSFIQIPEVDFQDLTSEAKSESQKRLICQFSNVSPTQHTCL